MPKFWELYDPFVRSLLPILLHFLFGFNALQFYVSREDCVPKLLLCTNINACCIMLTSFWHTKRAHDKRTLLDFCQAILVALAFLFFIAHLVVDYSQGLAPAIKGLPDQHSCRHMTGTLDNVKWSFYATGQHCDTTAQKDAIHGAVAKYIRNAENGTICGTQCLRLDHDGTWDGWLKLGSVGSFYENAYCGVGLTLDKCISGGNNDI